MKRIAAHYKAAENAAAIVKRSRQSSTKRDQKKDEKKLQKAVAKAFRLMIRKVREEQE